MKTFNLVIILLMIFSLSAKTQSKDLNYTTIKGKTGVYKISSGDGHNFVYKEGTPFNATDLTCLGYGVWPMKYSVNDKVYVRKYLKPEIKGKITVDNSRLSITYYYELSTGEIKWMTFFYDSSLTMPIEAIEDFEYVMKRDDRATFNRDSSNVPDSISCFPAYKTYDLLDM